MNEVQEMVDGIKEMVARMQALGPVASASVLKKSVADFRTKWRPEDPTQAEDFEIHLGGLLMLSSCYGIVTGRNAE